MHRTDLEHYSVFYKELGELRSYNSSDLLEVKKDIFSEYFKEDFSKLKSKDFKFSNSYHIFGETPYSISHTRGNLTALFMKHNISCGVDTELRKRKFNFGVVERVIPSVPVEWPRNIQMWTKLESLYKAFCQEAGKLKQDLPYSLIHEDISWLGTNELMTKYGRFRFLNGPDQPNYYTSICVKSGIL
ncbi:MAG: hypothetical protein AB8E15_12935 [Bdellovibrionales bacterium]